MATVNVNFTTKKQTVPATTWVTPNVQVSLMQGDISRAQQITALPASSASFTGVSDGTYTVTAQLLDGNGGPIGQAAVSEPVTVVNTVEVDVPDVVTVAFA